MGAGGASELLRGPGGRRWARGKLAAVGGGPLSPPCEGRLCPWARPGLGAVRGSASLIRWLGLWLTAGEGNGGVG